MQGSGQLFDLIMDAGKTISEKIKDEVIEMEGFVVDDDSKAEWAINKITEEKAEAQRLIDTCNNIILTYEQKIEKERERLNNKIAYFEGKLRQYFETVDKKKTKTQESYRLPSGTLKKKFKLNIEKDDEKLKEYLEKTNPDYILKTTIEKVKWADYKKTLKFEKGKAITADGEILKCVSVTEEEEFVVEV